MATLVCISQKKRKYTHHNTNICILVYKYVEKYTRYNIISVFSLSPKSLQLYKINVESQLFVSSLFSNLSLSRRPMCILAPTII
ncbi:hypothetical protein Hanom_Chr17g01584281 [Helianthus anomalus]